MKRTKLLIETWLPAGAIGVECIRERSTGQQPPDKRLHVWWARRPLCVSRAAVLGSLLPADFSHEVFERLLGFGLSGHDLVRIRQLMDSGRVVPGGFGCNRAFNRAMRESDLVKAHAAARSVFGQDIVVIDPMAGGGSIPFESARLGFHTLANEYNPVACTILEAILDYPFRLGDSLSERTRHWSREWITCIEKRLAAYFPKSSSGLVHAYIFARTVPCPDTGHYTPLVPDWHLLRPKKSGARVWAQPITDNKSGTWRIEIIDSRQQKASAKAPPAPTKNVSLFSGQQIPPDWIKAQAQSGKMKSVLYAVAIKGPAGLSFAAPTEVDLRALEKAEKTLSEYRDSFEHNNGIPIEAIPAGDKTREPMARGLTQWSQMFSSRQLLGFGIMLEELEKIRIKIANTEEKQLGDAVVHMIAFVIDKFANYNSVLSSWHPSHAIMRSVFDRHDFAFKLTFAEMAPCGSGAGLEWAVESTVQAWEQLARLPRSNGATPVNVSLGSATSLPSIRDGTVVAVVVDPPYADNVQYAELADFFYVWLKRTQGHRRPEWFSSYLCDHSEEAVVNVERHREEGEGAATGRRKAERFYQSLMESVFKEAHRILRDDGALTVMFTHKKQAAWEALFTSLAKANFTITATWPVKTESEHALNQAKKNAAQSTVILVARKRDAKADVGYFDAEMRREIRGAAQNTAERLMMEGLNPVDQLVGSFGPAMSVYSRYSEVRTDTGEAVGVERALDEASEAVADFRIRQLAARGLQEVESEGRFYLLCWDVLQAAEFRFNEASLLGKAVGMDVDSMVYAGLVSKTGDKIRILAAKDRRRAKRLDQNEMEETLFGAMPTGNRKRVKKSDVLKIHPNDPQFRTALDACHALALRFVEAGGGNPGVGSARQLATQQGWKENSPVARLMEALVKAAPPALRFERGKGSAAATYPEFRAWHAMLDALFGIAAPEWVEEELEPDMPLFAGTGLDEADGEGGEHDEEAGDEDEGEAVE